MYFSPPLELQGSKSRLPGSTERDENGRKCGMRLECHGSLVDVVVCYNHCQKLVLMGPLPTCYLKACQPDIMCDIQLETCPWPCLSTPCSSQHCRYSCFILLPIATAIPTRSQVVVLHLPRFDPNDLTIYVSKLVCGGVLSHSLKYNVFINLMILELLKIKSCNSYI